MDRRRAIASCAASFALVIGLSSQAQQRPWRIAMMLTGTASSNDPKLVAFQRAMRDLGYVEGESSAIDPHWAQLAQEMHEIATVVVRAKVDVIVTQGTTAAKAAQQATRTIPIVMATSGDPVAVGLVSNFARPGGNVTGQTILAAPLNEKRLELLREIVPGLSRVALLWNPENPMMAVTVKVADVAAKRFNIALLPLAVHRTDELERVFQAAINERADALLVPDDPLFTANRTRIVELAAKRHLPTMYGMSGIEQADGLASYGASLPELFRSVAGYVDKILKGAKPGDLPVAQPTKFELVLNLKAARSLGITFPPQLLLRADRLIE